MEFVFWVIGAPMMMLLHLYNDWFGLREPRQEEPTLQLRIRRVASRLPNSNKRAA